MPSPLVVPTVSNNYNHQWIMPQANYYEQEKSIFMMFYNTEICSRHFG